MLWIAVTLPGLPLEALRPPLLPALEMPQRCMVLAQHNRVTLLDATAAALGIQVGMSRTHAQALVPDLLLLGADPLREHEALAAVALALLRYTPRVVLTEAHTILLEVSASLRLFGGIRRLWRALSETLDGFAYRSVLACAPTAWGSWLLAQARVHTQMQAVGARVGASLRYRVLRAGMLTRMLERLPVALLPAAAPHLMALEQLGCDTLRVLRALPEAGVVRRFGSALPQQLAQAYGMAPDPREWFVAPASFAVRLELQARVANTEALLFAARRLLLQLAGWLAARHAAVSGYTLQLVHETARSGMPQVSELPVAWSAPSRDADHLAWLLREKFNQTRLLAPVLELRLITSQVEPYAPASDTLFPLPGIERDSMLRLVERLAARLGREAVLQMVPHADHRPEVALADTPCRIAAPRARARAGGAARTRTHAASTAAGSAGASVASSVGSLAKLSGSAGLRPAWLLETAQALAVREGRPVLQGALQKLSGPERIETGWWDSPGAARDYFVARDTRGSLCWIYRECRSGRWFLQGWFA